MAASNYDPQQLSLARQRQRLSTQQAALILDLDTAGYEALERGEGELSEAQLQKLALLFRRTKI